MSEIVKFKLKPIAQRYYNEDSCYGIYVCITQDEIEFYNNKSRSFDGSGYVYTTTIVGSMQKLEDGIEYEFDGVYEYNRKYHQHQYKALNIKPIKPITIKEQAKFLNNIISNRQAESLLSVYPNAIEMIINNEEFDLSLVKGIKDKTFEAIKTKVLSSFGDIEIINLLKPYGVTNSMIGKLKQKYTNASLLKDELLKNPYILTSIKGLGFKKVDSLALSINPNIKDSLFRATAYVKYTLQEMANASGHTRVKLTELDNMAEKDIHDCIVSYNELIDKSKKEPGLFIIKDDYIGLSSYFFKERFIYEKLSELESSQSILDTSCIDVELVYNQFYEHRGYELTDEQKDIVKAAIEHNVIILTGNAGCVDKDTEFFNGVKWKKISEYEVGDKVMQYNDDGTSTLVKPLAYIKNKQDTLYHFETKYGLNQCLSLNHNFAYITSKGNLAKKPFGEVMDMHNKSKCGFQGKVLTTFNYNSTTSIPLSDDEIRLMCAVIADGHFNHKSNWCRVNLKKETKKERLVKLLNSCNIEFKRYDKENGYSEFRFYAPLSHKEFHNDYWFNCSLEQLYVVADEVKFWDSSVTKSGSIRFSTTSKESADFVQFAFSSTGLRATISVNDRVGDEYITCGKMYMRKSVEYCVNTTTRTKVGIGGFHDTNNKTKINEYKTIDGYEYCFTVPSGYLVLRRNNKIFVTGNCGKSSCIYAIHLAFKQLEDAYIGQCALSAKAAQRISETTKAESKTIHRLLGATRDGFTYDEKNPLLQNVIILDEASMVNVDIFTSLMKSIKNGSKLIISFDDAQLPPIGAGNVATDLLSSKFRTVKLTKVHRQAESSGILSDANAIRKGINPLPKPEPSIVRGELKDQFYLFRDNSDEMFELAIKYFNKTLETQTVDDVVICVPRRENSKISTLSFNNKIQEILLGNEKTFIKRGDKIFKLGAKVIQRENNPELGIFNGDIGYVDSINIADKTYTVDFGNRRVELKDKHMDKMELAYSLTCHLLQGSQYHTVITVLSTDSYVLLSKEMTYTALTRAEKRGLVIAQPKAFNYGCKKAASKRNTWLQEFIK